MSIGKCSEVIGVVCLLMGFSPLPIASGALVSDDFNQCSLRTNIWTFVDPRGGGSATLSGIGTNDALLRLSVPGGPTHDLWTDGNNSVRVMQAAPNTNFEVQAKFQSQFTAGYQIEGLIVEQDAGRYLRFDCNYDGVHFFLFAATLSGGKVTIRRQINISSALPIWLDVKRAGNTWTLQYSLNGTSWTSVVSFSDTFTVNRVGLTAGNDLLGSSTSTPAFTALVDYFLNVAAPFTTEDGPPQLPAATLTTNVVGSGAVAVNPQKTAYYCGETVTLTAQPAAGWTFQGWSGDLSGSTPQQTLTMTQSHTVTATFTSSGGTPPVISQIQATPQSTSALIQWTTDVPATSRVNYGLTTSYELGNVSNPTLTTTHAITLTGLTAATLYHFQVVSANSAGNTATSADATFTTAQGPPPVISQIQATPQSTSALIQWTTDVAATSRVNYGLTTSYELGNVSNPTLTTTHAITLTGLTAATPYHFQVVSANSTGNTATSADATFTTTPAQTGGLVSDDFNTCTLKPVWTKVDPRGGGTVSLTGLGTNDALLQIGVPGGPTHDLWTDGNNSVRVMQTATNTDFEVQAKFQSQFTAGYQIEGLIVEQDANRYLRFDCNYDGARPFLFAATLSGGTVTIRRQLNIASALPIWLDVKRVGNTWTLQYSLNGTSWTSLVSFSDTFTVNRVGLTAGNDLLGSSTSTPAFTALVDYFLNPAAPFTTEDGPSPSGGGPGRTLTTAVTGQGTIAINPSAPLYYCNDAVTLTPQPAASWYFRSWGGDVTSSANPLTVTMTANLNVIASFAQVPFTRVVVDQNNPPEPWCKAVGDLTGDGLPDIIIASAANGGMWWYEAPTWTKRAIRTTGSWGTDMQVGDVDNDGDLDIIAPGMVWYENPRPAGDPRTAVWVQHTIGIVATNGSHDVEVADLDADGKLDVVIRPEGGSGTYAFFQDTPDSWTMVTLGTRAGEGTSIGDIDGDGDLDVAINGYWLENPGPSVARTSLWPEHVVDASWPTRVGVLIADVNGDGRKDIVLAPSESAGKFSWYEAANPKTGPWTEHLIDASVSYMHTFKSGDVDRDGNLDLITAEMHQSTTRRVGVYFNLGQGLSWSQEVIATTGSHNIRVTDIDGDGDIDIVGANWSDVAPDSAVITLWRNGLVPP
jgi:uncharacterized repeat protein (TIGR02543 family)